MDRNIRKIGFVNLLVLLVLGGAGYLLARYANTFSGQIAMVFFGAGFLVAAVSYFQMRLEESERLEQLEFEELARGRASGSLFSAADADSFPARRSREQFERFFVPALTLLLFIAEAVAAFGLWRWLDRAVTLPVRQPVVLLAWFAVFFLILFVLGKYSANVARLERRRLLAPGASFLVFGAYLSALVVMALALVWSGFPDADRWVARGLAVLLGLLAIETCISLILEVYRPRVRGKVSRLLYDSRLVGVLAHPESLLTTAAQALDYQFGFKVSETWFYRFLERALAWLILLQFGVLVLSTSFVFIEPGEEGIIERFGRPLSTQETLKPGLHLKLPWPVDRVYRSHTDRVQSFYVGAEHDEDEGEDDGHGHGASNTGQQPEPETVVWTVSHQKDEFNLLVASSLRVAPGRAASAAASADQEQGVPADLITVGVPVQYRIEDLFAWTYGHADAARMLESAGTREVVRFLSTSTLFSVMGEGREKATHALKESIQAEADRLKLGVRILFVGLQDIHPPIKVARSFEDVIGEVQQNEAKLLHAEGFSARTLALSEAEAGLRVFGAEAYSATERASAEAQARQFVHQMAAFDAAPEVFRTRAFLQAFERGATNARKYILTSTNTEEVILLNLEDRLRPELFEDIAVPPPR